MKPDFNIKEQFKKVVSKGKDKGIDITVNASVEDLEVFYRESLNDFCQHLIEKEKKECPHSETFSPLGGLFYNTAKLIK